jgi:hypothetical protein
VSAAPWLRRCLIAAALLVAALLGHELMGDRLGTAAVGHTVPAAR